jgi:transposase-like protein
VFFVVCDGPKRLPNSVNTIWPMATVQTCIIHLVRGSFRYASRPCGQPLPRHNEALP